MSEKNEKGLFDYFKISEAVDDVKSSYGAKDKTVSTLKLVGKGLFNSAKFVVESTPKVMQEVARQSMNNSERELKRNDLSEDKREKLNNINTHSRELYEDLKNRHEK
jgi:hypothetical protein